jgi:hypothetical protein
MGAVWADDMQAAFDELEDQGLANALHEDLESPAPGDQQELFENDEDEEDGQIHYIGGHGQRVRISDYIWSEEIGISKTRDTELIAAFEDANAIGKEFLDYPDDVRFSSGLLCEIHDDPDCLNNYELSRACRREQEGRENPTEMSTGAAAGAGALVGAALGLLLAKFAKGIQ